VILENEEEKKTTIEKEQKRAEEIKQRDEKIQKIMSSMGNII
jgi:hypothetical protein